MSNELIKFSFQDRSVRIIEKNGEPWFVAKDVCDILEHTNSRMALEILDDDEKGVSKVYTLGGNQDMNIINESGLYNLIFRSNKPEAKTFRKWVTSEVLPVIRKQGYFSMQTPLAIDPSIDFKGVALMLKAFSLGAITGAQFRQLIGLPPQDYQFESYSPYREVGRRRFDAAIAKDDVRLFVKNATSFDEEAITPSVEIYNSYCEYYGIDDIAIKRGEALSRIAFTRYIFREYPNVSEITARAGAEKKPMRCYHGMKLKTFEELNSMEQSE